MKKLATIYCILSAIAFSFSQETSDSINRKMGKGRTNTYVIEYDFKSGYFKKNNQKIIVNSPVIFKIVNINRLAYEVRVKAKDSVIGVSNMEGLTELFKKEQIENLEKQINTSDINKSNIQPFTAVVVDDFKGSEKENKELKKSINNFMIELSSKSNLPLNEMNKDDIKKALDSINSIKVVNKIDEDISNHLELQKKLTTLYLKILEKYYIMLNLSKEYLHISSFINEPLLSSNDQIDDLKLENIVLEFENNKIIKEDISLLVNQFQSEYNAIKTNIQLGKSTNYGGVMKLNYISDNQNVVINHINEKINKINFDDLRNELIQLKNLLKSQNRNLIFEYVSHPIQPFQDVVIFDVEIKKKKTDNNLIDNSRKFSHKEFVRHGLRLDVSLGVAGSLHSDKYSYAVKMNQNNENVIMKNDESIFTPSFVGFFTASRRSATHFSCGFSIGIGVSASEGSLTFDNFFVGPSLTVGKYERVTLTSGLSIKNLPVLNNGYQEGGIVPQQYTIENVSDKNYVPGFFISLSYNLTKGVKDNIKHMKSFY
jgi:hypothetical protein